MGEVKPHDYRVTESAGAAIQNSHQNQFFSSVGRMLGLEQERNRTPIFGSSNSEDPRISSFDLERNPYCQLRGYFSTRLLGRDIDKLHNRQDRHRRNKIPRGLAAGYRHWTILNSVV